MTQPNTLLTHVVSGNPSGAYSSSDPVENIAPGITCEWLYDRQLVVFTMTTVARKSVDALLDRVKMIVSGWPADRPYLAVYQVADSKNGPTPYIRERFRKIPQWRPELDAHVALVVARNFQGLLVQLFSQQTGTSHSFFSREEAVAWLRGFLATARHQG